MLTRVRNYYFNVFKLLCNFFKLRNFYKVWPSAYASGALVQCRKKGAANWGNSKKK